MIVYNHGKYLYQALDSVFMQEVDFDFEVVIGDDCSTDDSREIIRSYQKRHPGQIRTLFHEKNVGVHRNVVLTLQSCEGEYVALLEGDDYWTDPLKLKKQVDALEANPSCVISAHNTHDLNEVHPEQSKDTDLWSGRFITLGDILEKGWFLRTNSLVFRNGLIPVFPDWYFHHYSTDYMLQVLLASKGDIHFSPEVMAVYRRHEAGLSMVNRAKQITRYQNVLALLKVMDAYLDGKYAGQIRKQKKLYTEAIMVERFKQKTLKGWAQAALLLTGIDWSAFLKRRIFDRFALKVNQV